MATNEAGSSYNAIIDCLAESADDLNARFSHHWPQLSAYVDVLKLVRPDKPVRLVAINWLSKGKMTVRTI